MKNITKLLINAFIIICFVTGCSHSSSSTKIPTVIPTPSVTTIVTPTGVPTITQAISSTLAPTIIPSEISPTIGPSATPSILPTVTSIPSNSGSEDYNKVAKELLQSMTLEEKVGQIFFVRCPSQQATDQAKKYHLGGYLLFASDFKDKTKKEIINTIQSYQKASKITMLIGVDEEGGTVNRVSMFPAFRKVPFLSPQQLYQSGGYELITSDTIEKAKLLLSLGINVNLAPVCDISTNSNDFIYKRSFGKDAKETSKYVKTVVTTMNSQGIGSVLKHFPGYGNNGDTHTGGVIDTRSYQNFVEHDFLPFQAGIDAGAGCILVSHNIVNSMDKNYPASLSSAVHNILRETLGFQGVIMTDDLSMDAIKLYANEDAAAILAVNAGNDLLIASDYNVQIPAVIKAVKDHTITEKRLDDAVTKVLLWKFSLGILD